MLNETLRQRRKAIKLTQEQLAERVHVSRQTISNWETGRANPDYEMLKLLSDVLETPLTELLGVEEEAPTETPAPEAEAAPEPLPETPVQPRTDGRFSRWHMVLLLAAAILMVLAVQGLIGWWQHRPVPSPYPPEWFMEETPAAAGQACITMSVLETPIRPNIASPEDGYHLFEHMNLVNL